MSKVMLVASGKGGTGKTFFTANAGALLAMRGYKVVLIDMDMGLRNLDLYLGMENRVVYNVMDVLSGMCKISQALIKDRRFKSLYLIAASPARDERDITPLHLKVLCEKLCERFDYVIIDAPAGIGDGLELAAAGADTAAVITEAEFAAVRDADVVDRSLEKLGVEKRYCVINKVDAELMAMGAVPGISSVSRSMRMDIAGIIQDDDNIRIATNRGLPIVMKQGTYIEKNFSKITDRLLE